MPTSVNVFFGWRVSTPTRSPTVTPADFASAALMAISLSTCGPRPCRSLYQIVVPVQLMP